MCHWKRVSYSAAAISTMWEPTTTTSTCCPLHPEPLQRCVEGNVILGFAEEDQQCSPKITFSTKQGWFCCKEKTGVQCPPPCYYRKDMSYHLTPLVAYEGFFLWEVCLWTISMRKLIFYLVPLSSTILQKLYLLPPLMNPPSWHCRHFLLRSVR